MQKATLICGLKKAALLALTAVMLVSAMSTAAFAKEYGEINEVISGGIYGDYEKDSDFLAATYLYPGDILNCTPCTKAALIQYINKQGDILKTAPLYSKQPNVIPSISELVGNPTENTSGKWLIVNRAKYVVYADEKGTNLSGPALVLQYIPDDEIISIPIALPTVQLSRHSVTGYVGGTIDLDFHSFNMRTPEVTWTSSDEAVATVDADGVVTFVGKGKATITLDVSGYGQLTCTVTVKNKGLIKR